MILDNKPVDLTHSEYEILRVLWKNKRLTVREVHDQLVQSRNWAYTTTKTVMDRMAAKGLIDRQQFHGIYLYHAKITRPAGLARLVQFFAERVLEIDSASVVSLFAKANSLSEAEIDELSNLIEKEDE